VPPRPFFGRRGTAARSGWREHPFPRDDYRTRTGSRGRKETPERVAAKARSVSSASLGKPREVDPGSRGPAGSPRREGDKRRPVGFGDTMSEPDRPSRRPREFRSRRRAIRVPRPWPLAEDVRDSFLVEIDDRDRAGAGTVGGRTEKES